MSEAKTYLVAHRKLLIAVGAGALALVVAWTGLHRHGSDNDSGFRLAKVSSGPLVSTISASGTVKPTVMVSIVPQVSGQIVEVAAVVDSVVKKGDLLARIDPTPYEVRMQSAEADLKAAQAAVDVADGQLDRAKHMVSNARATAVAAGADIHHAKAELADADRNLRIKQELASTGDAAPIEPQQAKTARAVADSGLTTAQAHAKAASEAVAAAEADVEIADKQVANAQAVVALKEAALEQAKIDLGHTDVRAPFDGVVVDCNAVVGQTISGGGNTPLFTLAGDLKTMEVHASVDEADVGRIRVGQTAKFTFDAYPGENFTGNVVAVHRAPQPGTPNVVNYDVTISADNSDKKLFIGMTADVRIIVGEKQNTLRVPNAALRYRPPKKLEQVAGETAKLNGATTGDATATAIVWRLGANGKPTPLEIQTGLSNSEFTEVVGGLNPGDEVIVGGGAVKDEDQAKVGPLRM